MSNLSAELEGLRAALSRPQAAIPLPPEDEAKPQPEIEAMLKDLRDALASASEDASEAIAAHPAVAIGAAFLLGIIVGRMSGRL